MTVHNLKVRPPFYAALMSGAKTFELRRNDRDFHCGDTLVLEELDEHGDKTGHSIERHVTHILHSFTDKGDEAIADGFCIMSIRPTGEAVTVSEKFVVPEGALRDLPPLVPGAIKLTPSPSEREKELEAFVREFAAWADEDQGMWSANSLSNLKMQADHLLSDTEGE